MQKLKINLLQKKSDLENLRKNHCLQFEQVPLVQIDKLNLVQSGAIVRYLGNRFGLYGDDDNLKDKYEIDCIYESTKDARQPLLGYIRHRSKDDSKKAFNVERYLGSWEKSLSKHKNSYFIGKPSFADVTVYEVLSVYLEIFGEDVFTTQELARRSVLMVQTNIPTAPSFISMPALGLVPTNTTTWGSSTVTTVLENVNWTFLSWLSLGYYSNRGGLRYKIIPLQQPTTFFSWPDINFLGLLYSNQSTSGSGYIVSSSTAVVLNPSQSEWITEIELPMKIPNNFRPSYRQIISPNSVLVGETLCYTDQVGGYDAMIFQAGADDFTFGKYLFPPVLNTAVVLG